MISGHFGLRFIFPMPAVQVYVQLPGITTDFVGIDFLIDTGATHTSLHPQDAELRMGIDPTILSRPTSLGDRHSSRGIGGRAVYYVRPAIYAFHHDDGRLQYLNGEIQIARATATNADLPSLTGWDMLRYFQIELDYLGQKVTLR